MIRNIKGIYFLLCFLELFSAIISFKSLKTERIRKPLLLLRRTAHITATFLGTSAPASNPDTQTKCGDKKLLIFVFLSFIF